MSRYLRSLSSSNVKDWSGQQPYGNFSVPSRASITPPSEVEYLVIGGGGSGGGYIGGGGGAGGYRCSVVGETTGGGGSAEPKMAIYAGNKITVVVGAGGAGVSNSSNPGNMSMLGSIVALGGGRGNWFSSGQASLSLQGGSGGGGKAENPIAGGAAISDPVVQGYAGGNGRASAAPYSAGAGGGAGATPADPTASGAVGGAGLSSSITGTSVARGGGGGAGTYQNALGCAGGTGGGGAGNTGNSTAGSAGTANTGGGGGGGGGAGGSGGKGVVILRYPSTFSLASATTGSPTQTTTGGYHIYQFNDSGSITF